MLKEINDAGVVQKLIKIKPNKIKRVYKIGSDAPQDIYVKDQRTEL